MLGSSLESSWQHLPKTILLSLGNWEHVVHALSDAHSEQFSAIDASACWRTWSVYLSQSNAFCLHFESGLTRILHAHLHLHSHFVLVTLENSIPTCIHTLSYTVYVCMRGGSSVYIQHSITYFCSRSARSTALQLHSQCTSSYPRRGSVCWSWEVWLQCPPLQNKKHTRNVVCLKTRYYMYWTELCMLSMMNNVLTEAMMIKDNTQLLESLNVHVNVHEIMCMYKIFITAPELYRHKCPDCLSVSSSVSHCKPAHHVVAGCLLCFLQRKGADDKEYWHHGSFLWEIWSGENPRNTGWCQDMFLLTRVPTNERWKSGACQETQPTHAAVRKRSGVNPCKFIELHLVMVWGWLCNPSASHATRLA